MKYNPEKSIIKANLTKSLTDAANIELISYLTPQEIEPISILKAVIDAENRDRQKLGIEEENILDDVLFNLLLHRTSVNGLRSEQLVKILNSHIDSDNQKQIPNNTGGVGNNG